jgi:hypothetical protein
MLPEEGSHLRGLGTITSALAILIKIVPTIGYALDFVLRK